MVAIPSATATASGCSSWVGTIGQDVFLAMELVEGATVREWLLGERPAWRAIVDVFVRAGRGLIGGGGRGAVRPVDARPQRGQPGRGAALDGRSAVKQR